MKQPTKKQLREKIAELNESLYEIWKQLPEGELKDSIEEKHGRFTFINRRFAEWFNEKYSAANEYDYASWLGIFYNRSPQDEFYYYEAPKLIYPLQEDTDKLKTEA